MAWKISGPGASPKSTSGLNEGNSHLHPGSQSGWCSRPDPNAGVLPSKHEIKATPWYLQPELPPQYRAVRAAK